MGRLYYSFNQFLRERFGCRVHRLSLNAGFTCPNLDGSKSSQGCNFCSNPSFSYFADKKDISLGEQIRRSMERARQRFKAKKFIAYFQSFTNTYAEPGQLFDTYSIIRKFPDIVGLSISTRPDCIDEEKLKVIEGFTKDYMVWLEYGMQSSHDQSLAFLKRNHTFEDFRKAVELTKDRDILIAAHLILGIPGEGRKDVIATAKAIGRLPLSGVKFHCLHAVADTGLEALYNTGKASFLSLAGYVGMICDFLEYIPKEVVSLRLISDADPKYLIAPLWINQKQKVIRAIEDELRKRDSYQGCKCAVRNA